ncbi:MAG: hypothetical protein A2Y25_08430 [Candidatus Melainabacteria bacterium GWF2_37_15]|nr:MAG: hypothetical protein A2Y25_08430 [Candidatus Melainabacteria bacterium GWF2_37_15]
MENYFDIIGTGTAVIDDLLILPDFPTQNTKVEVLQRKKQVGGSVPMALKTLTSLDLKTAFMGKIGNDEDSSFIKKQLRESGINVTNLVEERGAKSPYSQVWININNGSRTIAVDSGKAPVLKERNLDFTCLAECKIFHIDSNEHDVTKKLINLYKTKGAKISIDTGRFKEKTLELLNMVDIIIMPLSFAMDWIGKYNFVGLISQVGAKYPNKLVIITDGEMGSICSCQGNIYRQKSFKVNCVDSTGVGGVYAGGILYGVTKNWEIPKTLEFAAAISALHCSKIGYDEMPGLAEVEAFLAN